MLAGRMAVTEVCRIGFEREREKERMKERADGREREREKEKKEGKYLNTFWYSVQPLGLDIPVI